jgi:hypothetical protein
MVVVRQDQLDDLLSDRQRANPLVEKPVRQTEKIETKIDLSVVAKTLSRPVGVLLYEPTTVLPHREMQCES